MSLSSRRAWIEIKTRYYEFRGGSSLSSRRAWIEIIEFTLGLVLITVALLTESVDWNDSGFYGYKKSLR